MNLKIQTKYLLIIITAMFINCQSLCQSAGLTSIGTQQVIGLSYEKDCILSLGGKAANEYNNSLTAQAGFAYNNFLAFQLGYHYFSDNPYFIVDRRTNYTEYTEGHFAHVAVGVFYPIKIKNSKKENIWKNKGKWYSPRHILLDAYVAYGKGFNNRALELSEFDSGAPLLINLSSNSILNFNKWYVQGGLHYNGHIFGAGISYVLGILNFRKITTQGLPDDDLVDLVNSLREDATYYTSGYQLKFSYTLNAITLLYRNYQNFILQQDILNYGLTKYHGEVSVQVNISKFFKKKMDEH